MTQKKMTQDDLLAWVKEGPMAAANTKKLDITDETVIESVIETKDIQGIMQKLAKWFLKKNGVNVPARWPSGWTKWSAVDFAKYFIPLMLLFISTFATAQLTIDLGTVKTADKNTAISVGISYFRSLDSVLKSKDIDFVGKHSIFSINPEFNVRFGTQDAFSSIQAKIVGSFMSFKTTDFRGFESPDFTKTLNVFPISLGVESNSSFTTYNGIFEAGYTPYYQSETSNVGDVLRHTKFGLWLQGGYKFRGDSNATALVGGAKDQSSEKIQSSIFRVKGNFGIDTKSLVNGDGLKVGLVGNADVWYDVIHSRFYHKVDAIARFYLSNGAWIDAIYSKGAGAPTFNSESQYGAGIKFQL